MNEITKDRNESIVPVPALEFPKSVGKLERLISGIYEAALGRIIQQAGIPGEIIGMLVDRARQNPTAAEQLGLPETAGPFLKSMDENPQSVKAALGVFADWLDERELDPDLAFACRWLHANDDAEFVAQELMHRDESGTVIEWQLLVGGNTCIFGVIKDQMAEMPQILKSCRDRIKELRSVLHL